MEINKIRKILEPQFGFLAKSSGEPLFIHSFTTWVIIKKIIKFCPSIDEDEQKILEISALIHDIGKMEPEWQKNIKLNPTKLPPHKMTNKEDVNNYFSKIDYPISEIEVKKITDIIRTHHSISEKDLYEINTSGVGFYTHLLIAADWIASMDIISYETINKLKTLYEGKIEIVSAEYSRFSSPTSMLIIKFIVNSFKKLDWDVLSFPQNGVIFIGKPNTKLPSKELILDDILESIIKESLSLQIPVPKRIDETFLTLFSEKFPDLFLMYHKDKILDSLGNIDNKYLVFLKLLREILKAKGLLEQKEKQNYPYLDLIDTASGHSGLTRRLFKEKMQNLNLPVPEKINNEALKPLFEKLKMKDIIPDTDIFNKYESEELLVNLKPNDLYNILENISKITPKKLLNTKERLINYLNGIVSIEEENDFKSIAMETFKKYKEYKKTQKAEKGLCEICGCPVSFSVSPVLNFTRATQAFSQIKPKYDYRAICPFCVYDNLILRKNIKGNKIRVFLRIETKVPEIFLPYFDDIKRLINIVNCAIHNPRNIEKFEDKVSLPHIPLPKRIEIPIPKKELDINPKDILFKENGFLFKLEDENEEEASSKNLRAKYEPLYHIMKYLGFNVSIGTEEQVLLAGEDIETTESNYYKSIATILLTKLLNKKNKKYFYSRNLLENSSSIVFSIVGKSTEKKKVAESFLKCLFRTIIKSNIKIIKREEVKVKCER